MKDSGLSVRPSAGIANGVCPTLPDRAVERAKLFEILALADTCNLGRMAVGEMWVFRY